MSRRSLGIALGYESGFFLLHLLNGRNGISTKLASKVTNLYPEISYDWLLNGIGEMINPHKKENDSQSDQMESIERHMKGQDARIERLESEIKALKV
ncbi:hypothetical protein OAB54_02500 [Flavobacteriaceae bacterium]|nr:hypothetical protein [Flavobacteriaceae bacterium]